MTDLLPADAYRNPMWESIELERVFRPSWQFVCATPDLPNVGSFMPVDLLGEPLLVVRGEDRIRVFSNVCMHRGFKLTDRPGCAKRIACPYHYWTYDLEGHLRSQAGGPPKGVPEGTISLVEHRVSVWHGLVFVQLTPSDIPAPTEVLPIEDVYLDYVHSWSDTIYAGNWKHVIDNNSDLAHVRYGHPGLKDLFDDYEGIPEPWHNTLRGRITSNRPRARWTNRMLISVSGISTITWYHLFPNTVIGVHGDLYIDVWQILPHGVGENRQRYARYLTRPERASAYLLDRVTNDYGEEDDLYIRRLDEGSRSATFDRGVVGEAEPCLTNIARWLRDKIPEWK